MKKIIPEFLKEKMKNALIIDGRRFLNAEEFKQKVRYVEIGLCTRA